MPPILALTLCTFCVFFLLDLDRKQYPEASVALWVPTLWMLMNATKPLGIWFGAGGSSMEEGSPLDRNVLIILALIAIIILVRRSFNWFNAISDNIVAFLLLGFTLVSILWSDMPFVSFKRWLRELIAVTMGFLVATEHDPLQALMSVFRRIIYFLIPLSYTLIHYFPSLGRQYGRWSGELVWVGVASAKNGLALFCLFALFILTWSLIVQRFSKLSHKKTLAIWYQPYIEMSIIIIALWLFMGPNHTLTYSATSTVALTIGLASLVALKWMKRHNMIIRSSSIMIIILAIIVLGTAASFYGGLMMSDVAIIFKRDESLTGRTDIWAYLVPYAMMNPVGGHGFGGFWTDALREATSSHAHNGYLDIILNTGFAGLILFCLFLISCSRKAHRLLLHDFDHGSLWICILFMIVIHNMAESSVTSFTEFFGGY